MDFNFFSQADQAGFELERARRALEAAKQQLEAAKLSFEDVMNRAEENGVSKPKLRKLVEERVDSLFESGLAEIASMVTSSAKSPAKTAKKSSKKSDVSPESSVEANREMGDDFADDDSAGSAIVLNANSEDDLNESLDDSEHADDVSVTRVKSNKGSASDSRSTIQ